jgi:caa(3)-type oxidase subunit IV
LDVHLSAGLFDVDENLREWATHRAAFPAAGENTMHDAAAHDDSKGQYFWVWGALLVLTAVEVWLGYRQIFAPVRMLEALMILSVIKSALIVGYFMHLKFEIALMRWMIVISVVGCFIIMYFFFFPDADRILHLGVK